MDTAGLLPAGGEEIMDVNDAPRLAAGCRLHATEPVLLVPEGALKLVGPAREILARLDGQKTVAAIVEELKSEYPEAPGAELEHDLLERMRQRGVVRS